MRRVARAEVRRGRERARGAGGPAAERCESGAKTVGHESMQDNAGMIE